MAGLLPVSISAPGRQDTDSYKLTTSSHWSYFHTQVSLYPPRPHSTTRHSSSSPARPTRTARVTAPPSSGRMTNYMKQSDIETFETKDNLFEVQKTFSFLSDRQKTNLFSFNTTFSFDTPQLVGNCKSDRNSATV